MDLLTPTTFDPFGPFFSAYDEAIVFDSIDEVVQNPASASVLMNSTKVGQLNTIFSGMFTSLGLTPSNAFNFATGYNGVGGGPASDYSPFQALASGGDFPTSLDATVTVPAIEVIPEPVSVFVWAILMTGAAFGSIRRRS